MMRQYQLVEMVRSYDPSADEEALNRAYVFSMKAHGTQQRASGDPYFSHPVEVAGILSEKKLDTASIVTGLLHDTVEDTVATLDDIERLFGDEISRLVDGVTKLGQLELQSDQTKQAENFRKLLLAMSEDIRVLLVKLADRLHNMRTLSYIPKPEKRARIARETMDIYAPLAERIGIRDWKDELEDLAFTELNADARDSILNRLGFLREQGEDLVGQVVNELEQTLAAEGVKAQVLGREKKAYSIWRKMQRRDVEFGQLSDIVAFRIIVDNIEDCYRTLGIIHNRYQVVPGRFKDYISIPKPNGYSSIHTGIMGPQMQRVEVQIRTQSMDEIAELGVAAHWQYKQGDSDPVKEGTQYRWLRELLEILEHAAEPEEFLEHTKLEMFADQVFCFTPKGDLFAMPFGATPVDFAYAVHTDVGNTCVAAKINGRIMPLRTRLKNGDQVEITISKAQTPSPAWEAFVATGKARACIRRFIRSQRLEQYESLGREIVEKAFSRDGYELTRKAIKGVLKKLDAENEVELYAAVGEGQTTGRDVLEAVYPGAKRRDNQKHRHARRGPTETKEDISRHSDQGFDPRHGRAFRGVLSSAAGRSHCRYRHDREGRHYPYDRLRDAGSFPGSTGTLDRRRLGAGIVGRVPAHRTDTHDFIQHAGQPWHVVYRHRAGRRQYLQSEGNKSFCRLFRIIGRYRSYGRKTIDRYYRRLACEFGHSCGRTSARLGVAPRNIDGRET